MIKTSPMCKVVEKTIISYVILEDVTDEFMPYRDCIQHFPEGGFALIDTIKAFRSQFPGLGLCEAKALTEYLTTGFGFCGGINGEDVHKSLWKWRRA